VFVAQEVDWDRIRERLYDDDVRCEDCGRPIPDVPTAKKSTPASDYTSALQLCWSVGMVANATHISPTKASRCFSRK
jgi:hypothetical protein